MVQFNLTDILDKSGLALASDEIVELIYQLSTKHASYISNLYNLRTGKFPSEGQMLSDSGNEYMISFVRDVISNESNNADIYLSSVYTDNVFQVLVATGCIPVAWLYKNEPACVKARMIAIRDVWEAIVSDYDGPTRKDTTIYGLIRSFGMATHREIGHTKEHLKWFLVPRTEAEMNTLTTWVNLNHLSDYVILISQSKLPEYLVSENYTFLFKFDKAVNAYTGTTFQLTTEITKAIPTYLVKIGCDRMCFFTKTDETDQYSVIQNRYRVKDLKRGEIVKETVSMPNNHTVSFVTINGVPYFIGTANATAAGISVVETEVQMSTGYRTFDVLVSGITEPASIFIDACEDFTGRSTSKKVISRVNSKLIVTDDDITIHLVFNRPFIFFDTSKVEVYARKDEYSEEELIESIQVVGDGYQYVERKATFGELTTQIPTSENSCVCGAFNSQLGINGQPLDGVMLPGHHYGQEKDCHPYHRDNPHVIHFLKPPYAQLNTPKEETAETRAILYGVNECGHIIISFDGYTGYKFFRVTFKDRAMVMTYKIAGSTCDTDIIPVIEDFFAKNPLIEDKEPDLENPDNNGDNTGEIKDPTEGENPDNIKEPETGGGEQPGSNTGGGIGEGEIGEGEVDW